ncbi:N-acetyllactosaminide beta-1,3-N-acetylglucosaminyltransferase 2-like [Aotus nancymaae]|uniref:N-acetyllactosaminide beta-1,3-N-acetylglucosaminyltransferase 2-like n=1 Tax=Aotus nancymaae TaxID=37293 RepID=UPI0030FE2635
MMANVFIYFIVEVSKSSSQGKNGKGEVIIPKEKFWKISTPPEAYWNGEQEKLSRRYSPILSMLANQTAEAGRLSNVSHLNSCEPDLRVTSVVTGFNNLLDDLDFLLYLRCRNYSLLIDQPEKCAKKPFLLLAIKSLTPHFARRQAIRESWVRESNAGNRTMVRVFLLGQTPPEDNHPDLSDMLKLESEKHQDILTWNYRDTFFNLSLKEVLFLRWVSTSCPDTEFVSKGDDDVFVNTHHILNYLSSLSKSKAKDLFIGDVIHNAGPHRGKKLKYYIPEVFTPASTHPMRGGGVGVGFLYSGHLARRLYHITDQVHLYPIDDVYTGMCLQKLGLVPEKHKGFRTFDIEEKNKNNICSYVDLMLVHSRKPQEMIDIGLSCRVLI